MELTGAGNTAIVEIVSIQGSKISEDGRLVLLNCTARDGSSRRFKIPSEALSNTVANLQILTMSADLIRQTSDPIILPTVRFFEPEPVFIVVGLGGTVIPQTEMIQLRVRDVDGNAFQLSMMKEQSRTLYDLLLDVWGVKE